MRRTYLGEFEEVVLLMVAILDGEGYGVSVSQALEEHTGRVVTFGTVHNTLIRLEGKASCIPNWAELPPNGAAGESDCFGLRRWAVGRYRRFNNFGRNYGNWFLPNRYS